MKHFQNWFVFIQRNAPESVACDYDTFLLLYDMSWYWSSLILIVCIMIGKTLSLANYDYINVSFQEGIVMYCLLL